MRKPISTRTFVRVYTYSDSYQLAGYTLFAVSSENAFQQLRVDYEKEFLPKSRAGSTPECQKQTFWATFSLCDTQDGEFIEDFESRVKI